MDRPSSSDRSDRSATKGSTGNRSHWSPDTGNTGHQSHQSLVTPGAPVKLVRPDAPVISVKPGAPVTPGIPRAPVNTGQKALEAQHTQLLDRSELIVLNSPVRPVQLEHNVHESLDLLNSDSLDDRADESPERSILRHSGHQSPATGHTGTGHTGHTGIGHTSTGHTGTGHTGHRSDLEHLVRLSHLFRSDAVDHRSTLLNLTLQEHRLELEYGSASDRTRHRSRSSRKDRGTHLAAISLRHADPGELSPASMLRSRSRSYDAVSPRRHSRSPLVREGRKRSHIRRGSTLPVNPNLLAQLKGRILHQNPDHLQLHAWELSINLSEIDNFQAMLRSTSPKL